MTLTKQGKGVTIAQITKTIQILREQDIGSVHERHRDVQAPLTSLHVERTEAIEQPSIRRLPVSDREDDGIALVSLYVLQVLDENGLLDFLSEETINGGVLTSSFF